jgi:hypothetical protein
MFIQVVDFCEDAEADSAGNFTVAALSPREYLY